MSLWTELKRRNVFRIAAAYVVIGWLMLQVADIVLGFTGAPDWVGKALIAFLVLGFIPMLALAWVFEVGPEGIRVDDGSSQRDAGPQARRLDVVTLGAVVLVVILMIGQHLGPALLSPQTDTDSQAPSPGGRPDASPAVDTGADQPAAPVIRRSVPEPDPWIPPPGSIAALPFTNRSANEENRYFVDGIHDELLTELSRNPALKVISRTSVMEYADTVKNLREIGTELGVANILEGAVQRSGDQVRITVQLINAATDAHIWAETYDRQLTPKNLFAVQTDIAADIALALGQQIAPEAEVAARRAPTENADAYDLFLQARGQFADISEPSIKTRIELYRRAVELDPGFAAAMGELGREYTNLYWFISRRDSHREQGGEWIDKALALQPDDPRLRLAKAEHFYRADLDYEAALAELDRANNGLPGSAEIPMLRAAIKRRQGLPVEALELLQDAALLDPRSVLVLFTLVETHWLTGDLEQARRWQRRLSALPEGTDRLWRKGYSWARFRYWGEQPQELLAMTPEAFAEPDNNLVGNDPFRWFLFRREFEKSGGYLDALQGRPISDQFEWQPIELYRALLAHAQGSADQARILSEAALARIADELEVQPDDYRIYMAQALAQALLGRTNEARQAMETALAQHVPQRDRIIQSELRGQHTSRKLNWATLIAALLAIGLLVADRLMPEAPTAMVVQTSSTPASPADPAPEASGDAPDPASIAVLPFEDLSPNGDQGYFSDGIAEEILNVPVRIDGLEVASRTSAFRFRNRDDIGIPGIARELEVRHVLEGSVRKAGDAIRVTAQLIDGRSDKHLWSDTYDRSLTAENVFAIQDEIATAIVEALRGSIALPGAEALEVGARTDSLDAYELYLEARALYNARNRMDRADELLARAVEIDPEFAAAWAIRAAIHVLDDEYGDLGLARDVSVARFEEYAAAALANDPDNALAIAGLAMGRLTEARFGRTPHGISQIIDDLERAITLDPKNASARNWLGIAYGEVGELEAALAQFQVCNDDDPYYAPCAENVYDTLTSLGRMDEALAAYLRALDAGATTDEWLSPSLLAHFDLKAHFMYVTNQSLYLPGWRRHGELWAAWKNLEGDHEALAREIRAYADEHLDLADNSSHAVNLLVPLGGSFDLNPFSILIWGDAYGKYRQSPEFRTRVRYLDIQAYWREHGFPPKCRPTGATSGEGDFECD